MGWFNDLISFGPSDEEIEEQKFRSIVENSADTISREGFFGGEPQGPRPEESPITGILAERIRPRRIPELPRLEGVLDQNQKEQIRDLLDERRERVSQIEQAQARIDRTVDTINRINFLSTQQLNLLEASIRRRDLLIEGNSIDSLSSIIAEIRRIQGNSTTGNLRLQANGTINDIGGNVLNDFVDVQYHISLTMVGESYARELLNSGLSANEITLNALQEGALGSPERPFRRSSRTVTLASTGEAFRKPEDDLRAGIFEQIGQFGEFGQVSEEELGRRDYNYYNISSMGVQNVFAPSAQNPMLSTFTSIKMVISEPAGFKLHEDIRNIARSLGYTNINPGRIVYRIDVFFSGYDPRTGQWVNKIPLGNGETPDIVSYFVSLADIQAKVESKGTTYEADFVPVGNFAYRPEEASFQANSLFSSEINTFGGFLDRLESLMNEAKTRRTSGRLRRNYQFFCPEFLRNATFLAKRYGVENRYILENQREGNMLAIGDDVDLLTLLRGAMADVPLVQQLLLNGGDSSFVEPRVMFGVRFNTMYGNPDGNPQINVDLNDYDELTYQYIIEPYVTFKKGTVDPSNINQYMAKQSQLERIRQIIRLGMLSKIYSYIYTSENTEVIDFDINLKSFYYTTLNTIYDNTQTSGVTSDRSASNILEARQEQEALVDTDLSALGLSQGETGDEREVLERLFGTSDISEIETGEGLSPQERLGGGFGELPDSDYFVGSQQNGSPVKNNYTNYIEDHLRNDLLTLDNMKVRGDPLWLFSPYANADLDTVRIPNNEIDNTKPQSNVRIYPRTGKILFLKMLAPDQSDLANQNRSGASSYPNIIGGFYEVTTVNSTFENGNFTQEIDGVKLNHLNYVEEAFGDGVSFDSQFNAATFFLNQFSGRSRSEDQQKEFKTTNNPQEGRVF